MKIEGIYRNDVKKFLEKQYLLRIKDIDYFPIGEDGASYIVKTQGRKYYCKVYNKVPIAYASIRRIKVIMNFLFDAHEKFEFGNAPLPIKNKHRNLVSKFKGHPVILYDYIYGGNLKKFFNKDYKDLGDILAKLHLINKRHFPNLSNENISLEWEKKIFKSIKELKKGKFHKDSNCGTLKKVILKEEELFLEVVRFLEKKVEYISKRKKKYVVSHNDLHWGNLMKDEKDIFIIDWDGLELALPEKDIMFFSKGLVPNKIFWKEYNRNRKHKLDKKAMEYYVIRRILSDVTFFSRVILHTRVEKKRSNEYMKAIKEGIEELREFLKLWGVGE